jgi:uncharacterized membrane protein YjgN (DUF898 family)
MYDVILIVILIVAILDVVVGLIFLGVCIPLVQRKIGRNALYGFRTRETLASDKAWYTVNHGAAKAGVYMSIGMVIFGVVVALLGIVQVLLPSTMSELMEDAVLFAAVAAPGAFIVGLIVATNIELKKLDRSTGDGHADPEGML